MWNASNSSHCIQFLCATNNRYVQLLLLFYKLICFFCFFESDCLSFISSITTLPPKKIITPKIAALWCDPQAKHLMLKKCCCCCYMYGHCCCCYCCCIITTTYQLTTPRHKCIACFIFRCSCGLSQ